VTTSRRSDSGLLRLAACGALVALAIGLRLIALRSDPYPRLDWSAGLLTDEGFYIHNARNAALFGREVTDQFNNMLLSPILHLAQVWVFRWFGVGALQARLISVLCSLGAMALLWGAMRPLFGAVAAWVAAGLLGLDHTNLLYSRMALMDPPAAFGATAAFACFVHACLSYRANPARGHVLFGLAGLILGATILNRSLCVYMLPAPIVALWVLRATRLPLAAVTGGACLALVAWAVLWYAPNRPEINRTSRYYRVHQVQPTSLAKLWRNLSQGAFGDHRGLTPYMFRHTPVTLAISLAFLASCLLTTRSGGVRPNLARQAGLTYLATWLVCGWLALSASSYSPSRYYVTTFPALMGVAGVAFGSLREVAGRLLGADARARVVRGALTWFLLYHAAQSLVHRGGVMGPSMTAVALWVVPSAAACLVGACIPPAPRAAALAAWLVPALWAGANGFWLTDWLRTMDHSQTRMSRELAASLPRGSVLIGDVAPGICMDNRFAAINVIPGLCNGDRPVERFAGRPRFVAILDGRWKERYWLDRYPGLVRAENRIMIRRVLRWDIGVYAVDRAGAVTHHQTTTSMARARLGPPRAGRRKDA